MRSVGIGKGDRLAGGAGIADLPSRGLADVPAGVDNQDPVRQVDLAKVECVQRGLLLVSDLPEWFAMSEDAWCDDDGTRKGQVAVSREHLCRETGGAADAHDLGPVGMWAAHGRETMRVPALGMRERDTSGRGARPTPSARDDGFARLCGVAPKDHPEHERVEEGAGGEGRQHPHAIVLEGHHAEAQRPGEHEGEIHGQGAVPVALRDCAEDQKKCHRQVDARQSSCDSATRILTGREEASE